MIQSKYNLVYNESEESIIEISPTGKKRTLEKDFPSIPIISPNQKYAIYIAPLEWEVSGNLYLYDLHKGKNKVCIKPDENDNIPKYATWLNEHLIIVIIGHGHGTVAVGGNVYLYDIETESKIQITNYPSKIQITKVELENDLIIFKGIEYIDDTLNDFQTYEATISREEILFEIENQGGQKNE